jgi:hypothetical protein
MADYFFKDHYFGHRAGQTEIENLFRSTALAVGLMEIENIFRSTALAAGLKPSAMQGEARLRGLWRIISSKTIISVTVRGRRRLRI